MSSPITVRRFPDHRSAVVTQIPPERYRRLGEVPTTGAQMLELDFRSTGTEGPAPWPATLPEPTAWVPTLVVAIMEAMNGQRSPAQVRPWLSPALARTVGRRAEVATRRRLPATTVQIRGLHLQPTAGGAVEAGMLVVTGGRPRAVALRLEPWGRRWLVTALEMA